MVEAGILEAGRVLIKCYRSVWHVSGDEYISWSNFEILAYLNYAVKALSTFMQRNIILHPVFKIIKE